MSERDDALVYAVVCPSQATIKVGSSVDPMARLATIRTSCSAWVFLWAAWPGGRSGERAAHLDLKHHRVRGEWFTAHPDVVAYVADRCGRSDWAVAIRDNYRAAGALMWRTCAWAALLDEREDGPREGEHRHGACSVRQGPWGPVRARSDADLVDGCRYVDGPLVAVEMVNDVGSSYWVLDNRIGGRPRRSRQPAPDVDQIALFEPRS